MFQTLPESAHWKDVATKPEEDMLKALIAPVIDWVGIVALGTLFHRRALERVGSWDEGLYVTDMDYWLRAAHLGCRFGHCSGSIMGFQRRRSGQMTANESAMAEGLQAVWEKTLTYLTHEPYRSLLAVNVAQCRLHLARIKFRMAFSTDRMSRREALAKLSLARATNPEAISALAYVVGYAVITLPGGAALVRSRWLGPIRRRVWKDWYES
jgi:GT2 family glycosyltransferase